MGLAFHDRLLRRELGNTTRYSGVRGIYGDKRWVDDLDIVNELDGHTGCVNALSWSKSGTLLASGSDDTRIHIHSYLPDGSTSQFNLATSIVTGHTQNIFSVKFMPHSNDRTIVSVAGDATVRIFDVEYSRNRATAGSSSRSPRDGAVWENTNHLSEGDTNAKVFRSHGDRVKRIVTESSPYFFLTCSEDGEVRQWDLREPESTYPGISRNHHYGPRSNTNNDRVPPPLISYKRYNIDLNTISCSPSRPYYIALGGNHLHCFLHDRRMLGRDLLAERGTKISPSSSKTASSRDDELMAQATQCVRRFAPNGQPRMGRTDTGHITACKISDANPNELIASWSGDHIYSFDVIRSPDAREGVARLKSPSSTAKNVNGKVKESRDRKRKRAKEGSTMSLEAAERGGSRARTSSESELHTEDVSLRVNYGNGQREEIPIEPPRARSPATEAREAELPDFQRQSFRIAKGSVLLRRCIFDPDAMTSESTPSRRSTATSSNAPPSQSPTVHPSSNVTAYSRALTVASSLMPEIEDVIRTWRYPVNPLPVDVTFQRKLRIDREKSARFVQATGTLARVLGGRIRTLGGANADAAKMELFSHIKAALNESHPVPQHEQFGYDFLKAICLWLDSGPGGVVRNFTKGSGVRNSPRFPIVPESADGEASIDALDEQLIPYLLGLASDKPVLNIDASPFELDERTVVFESETAAVLSFAQAVKIPFEDLTTGAIIPASPTAADRVAAQDRKTALRFWGLKVARGILMNASEGVDFRLVDHAFGGLGRPDASIKEDEKELARLGKRINPEEEEEEVQEASLVTRMAAPTSSREDEEPIGSEAAEERAEEQAEREDEDDIDTGEIIEIEEAEDEEDDEDVDMENTANDSSGEEEEEDEGSSDDDDGPHHVLYRSGRMRNLRKSRVNADTPVSSHTRSYEGHCNVKTVKDVNFFGLQDEYVVSGSDSGHLFIWDRKTAKLVNILEGDGEVVNVIQSHPYEPMIAVSGIDHTIKIFSPDARARRDARLGIGVRKVDESDFSSIQGLDGNGSVPPVADGGLSSKKRMWDEYRIRSQNDSDRRGNNRGEYISRSMIQLLMGRLREELVETEDGGGGEGEMPRTLVLDEDRCAVSLALAWQSTLGQSSIDS
ncbi:wd and tetratricopeptide repeat protein [Rhizodiscina lignyota]|uniref:Wd and tetratricopeptide repeat protein n=1 Tax=Rhizodiscina lignyota TaxID=1504668 RepID=A0A9P4M3E5_9PEZI|nr:wd and tetratricopeptide repeat protein [Rhizodiscina lignyota]